MRVWIGTAGYSYPDWRGGFYPHELAASQMLGFYSQSFPFVELNTTFHRCPSKATIRRMAQQAPPGFRFALKVPHSITHSLSDRDVGAFRDSIDALDGKLSMLVAQFPPSFHHSLRNSGWLTHLANVFAEQPLGFEFRHWSWSRPDVLPWLDDLGVTLISVDVPSIPILYPRGLVRTGKTIYVRLHSRNPESWYGPETERHDYVFTDHQLHEWADLLERASVHCNEAYLVFNNGRDAQSVKDGLRMAEILRERTWLTVSPAFPAIEPQQLSLFDA
ncbi:MAG: DUF72 domain-containing protein [Gemmataceae bacterium]